MNAINVMNQQAVSNYGDLSLTAADVRAQVNLIQDVMRSVMIEGTHYGKIPGTQSVSLYKPGAEKLMSTFRLAAEPLVEDLGKNGEVHYRVILKLLSHSGHFLGSGVGECTSQEDKYAWRAAVCNEEFDETPENKRRIKYSKRNNGVEKRRQVRTNPADVANTILKMAKKRALVDAVITVTAASDIFTQDIEDLSDEIRNEIIDVAQSRANQGVRATERIVPQDTPDRLALIESLMLIADLGTEAFRLHWKDKLSKDERNLVLDKVDTFKARADLADKSVLTNKENEHAAEHP